MSNLSNCVRFIGQVYPAGIKISISAQDITFSEGKGLFSARFNVSVIDSIINISCHFDKVIPDHPYSLWAQAQEITQTLVNLVAFQMGAGTITVLNEWIDQVGKRDTLAFADPALPSLCTAFSKNGGFDQVIRLVFAEPGLFMALNDIVLANAMPRHVLINCARCIETIRYLIAPTGTKRDAAWVMMQDALNADRTYLTFITNHSVEPRHGKQTEFDNSNILEVRARTWKVMDRFLHYRLGGNNNLPITTFPILQG
jgi:hypothetical protein